MCLSNISKEKIATKDMVVYKVLRRRYNYKVLDNANGKKFTGIIRSIKVEGVISINQARDIYFCTNEPRLNGATADNKYGYEYSWWLDSDVDRGSIKVGNKLLFLTTHIFETIYQGVPIVLGETYTSRIYVETSTINIAIHSYVNRKDAIISETEGNRVIVKCIIPKGSRYHEGNFRSYPSIASDTIIYGKRAYKI
jgi:hypothetical protein